MLELTGNLVCQSLGIGSCESVCSCFSGWGANKPYTDLDFAKLQLSTLIVIKTNQEGNWGCKHTVTQMFCMNSWKTYKEGCQRTGRELNKEREKHRLSNTFLLMKRKKQKKMTFTVRQQSCVLHDLFVCSFKGMNLNASLLKCKRCPVVHPSPVCGTDGHVYSTKVTCTYIYGLLQLLATTRSRFNPRECMFS